MAKADVPLPDWAPENPSEEFLRAWRVLKPAPLEGFVAEAEGDDALQAARKRVVACWPAHYELFGSLTDGQIERFLSAGEVRIPAADLTAKQQNAVDRFFEQWRQVMKGTDYEDFLIILYKVGAKSDFSNVEVGFDTGQTKTHLVLVKFWVTLPDGNVVEPCNAFASI